MRVWVPLDSFRCEWVSYTLSLTQTDTPSTASDMLTTPAKSSLMKWSMGMPVSR
ncbi:hypothetical protein M878_00790 [Streptomyces roseochromogenus subsp. oscitans DS 12.976]|uniref:Uncharacterized protein n=1 Tax=Streptomyces roseochromogenus subsp. oscitans DS 12.976 TaxID=1352936 RepID=V6L639_STRRC|nr:hypothetical protein M878_00790 [Streptomyces roseochromogenus subsp. oscitans DS 12.976]